LITSNTRIMVPFSLAVATRLPVGDNSNAKIGDLWASIFCFWLGLSNTISTVPYFLLGMAIMRLSVWLATEHNPIVFWQVSSKSNTLKSDKLKTNTLVSNARTQRSGLSRTALT
jgi:hypothetical protein